MNADDLLFPEAPASLPSELRTWSPSGGKMPAIPPESRDGVDRMFETEEGLFVGLDPRLVAFYRTDEVSGRRRVELAGELRSLANRILPVETAAGALGFADAIFAWDGPDRASLLGGVTMPARTIDGEIRFFPVIALGTATNPAQILFHEAWHTHRANGRVPKEVSDDLYRTAEGDAGLAERLGLPGELRAASRSILGEELGAYAFELLAREGLAAGAGQGSVGGGPRRPVVWPQVAASLPDSFKKTAAALIEGDLAHQPGSHEAAWSSLRSHHRRDPDHLMMDVALRPFPSFSLGSLTPAHPPLKWGAEPELKAGRATWFAQIADPRFQGAGYELRYDSGSRQSELYFRPSRGAVRWLMSGFNRPTLVAAREHSEPLIGSHYGQLSRIAGQGRSTGPRVQYALQKAPRGETWPKVLAIADDPSDGTVRVVLALPGNQTDARSGYVDVDEARELLSREFGRPLFKVSEPTTRGGAAHELLDILSRPLAQNFDGGFLPGFADVEREIRRTRRIPTVADLPWARATDEDVEVLRDRFRFEGAARSTLRQVAQALGSDGEGAEISISRAGRLATPTASLRTGDLELSVGQDYRGKPFLMWRSNSPPHRPELIEGPSPVGAAPRPAGRRATAIADYRHRPLRAANIYGSPELLETPAALADLLRTETARARASIDRAVLDSLTADGTTTAQFRVPAGAAVFHVLPITPVRLIEQLQGRNFLVSHARPEQAEEAFRVGARVLLDNGAFTKWREGEKIVDWSGYWSWAADLVRRHPDRAVAIIPDVIDGSPDENDRLVADAAERVARGEFARAQLMPVWHLHEPLDRLKDLAAAWPAIAFGSSGDFASLGTPAWRDRIRDAFAAIDDGTGRPKVPVHMLRGIAQLYGSPDLPFASADSSNIARNHHRHRVSENHVRRFAERIEERVAAARPVPDIPEGVRRAVDASDGSPSTWPSWSGHTERDLARAWLAALRPDQVATGQGAISVGDPPVATALPPEPGRRLGGPEGARTQARKSRPSSPVGTGGWNSASPRSRTGAGSSPARPARLRPRSSPRRITPGARHR